MSDEEVNNDNEAHTDDLLLKSIAVDNEDFDAVAAQVLSGDNVTQGYTFYDLISRSLHQLARDGNDELLALAIDRLGEQSYRRINQLDDAKLAPLHYAARYAHPNTIRTLLQRHAEVNIRGQAGLSPLHFAARYRLPLKSAIRRRQRQNRAKDATSILSNGPEIEEVEEVAEDGHSSAVDEMELISMTSETVVAEDTPESVVKVLVDNGAEINARDVYGLTPLHYAAMRGNDVAAQDLLAYDQLIDTEARDKQQMTPLYIAVMYGYGEICKQLLSTGVNYMSPDEFDQTPLHKAAAEGHLEIIELLLAAAEKNISSGIRAMLSLKDAEKQTPLHVAVTNGHIQCAKILLERGADVNCVRDTLATPLHAAAMVGNTDLIQLLFQHGANVDAVDSNQQTPLHRASANNQSDAIIALLDRNAKVEKRDRDSFTPLLLAASSGHPESLTTLLDRGAHLEAVDKEDKTVVFWCAEQGHVEALKVLLADCRCSELVDVSDMYDNSPLHEAARRGYLKVLKELLDAGSSIDNKNEDAETALHIAAEEGHNKVVKELIRRNRFLINDENEDADTPLHLASLKGRHEVVEELLEAGADVEARNTSLWTPLDCASASGHATVCSLLLDYDSPLDPLDKTKTTPLQLAAKQGHVSVISLLLEKGASVDVCDASGRNALELAIATGQRNVALAIVRSDQWMAALTNVRQNPKHPDRKLTPFRMLINKYPDVAEVVLDRCTTTNGLDSEEDDFGIKFNFEYVDDTYIVPQYILEEMSPQHGLTHNALYNDENNLIEYAEPYTDNTRIIRNNHPLSLMVKHKRSGLLGHPVVVALVRHKWNSYVRYVYYSNLLFYCIFLSALTGYVVHSIDWNYVNFLMDKNSTKSTTNGDEAGTSLECTEIQAQLGLIMPDFIPISKWIIIVMAVLNILREVFQFYQARLNYLGIENLLEWICYIFALILVWDWQSTSQCFIREAWQWRLGAVAIFLAWINLVLFIRRLPFFGIYVVMFTDVLRTFSKFFIVFFLFIIAFALGFYMLMRSQVPFDEVGKSLLKTTVMMIGEFEYDSIFSTADQNALLYPAISHSLFVIFMIVMSVLIMNLLVGLAVDDIKVVQDQAILKRLAMQAELVMEVEVVIPEALRRHFSQPFAIVRPNKHKTRIDKLSDDLKRFRDIDFNDLEGEVQRDAKDSMQRSITLLHTQMDDLKLQNQRLNIMLTALMGMSKRHSDDVDNSSL